MDDALDRYIARLANFPSQATLYNQYASFGPPPDSQANAIRRANLRLYLRRLAAARPWLLLVGEAPGYRGCRLTGVPFTSEAILLGNRHWLFGVENGFRKTSERPQVSREATATILWAAINDHRPPPLLWNALPFHPHHPADPASNRRPLVAELELGAAFLVEILELFPIRAVAAVGRCADRALAIAGIADYHRLRHPSHGGKAAFLAGLDQLEDSPPA